MDNEVMGDTTSLKDIPPACLAMRVRKASRVLTRHYEEALRPLGLTAAQFTLLVHLVEGAGRSISFLAEVMRVDRTTLTRNLRILERAGLAAVGTEGFRRQRPIEITPAGRDVLERGLPLWDEAQSAVERHLGGDRDEARRLLERLADLGP
ncbi:MAG: MarR family winged helix-turn-helix transcriptional regulator [Acidobacteriota bacterium]